MMNNIVYKKKFTDAYFIQSSFKIRIINFLKIVIKEQVAEIYLTDKKFLALPKSKMLIVSKRKK